MTSSPTQPPQPGLPKNLLEYVILVSNDDQEFYLEKKIANLSQVLDAKIRLAPVVKKYKRVTLDQIKGKDLEIVVQYLHYKGRYMLTDFEKYPPPAFPIDPKRALEVLKAAIYLQI